MGLRMGRSARVRQCQCFGILVRFPPTHRFHCDLSEGQKIIGKGDRIRTTTQALLASQGLADLNVGGEARAVIISTGDELAKPGEKLQPGQIYETNSVLLQSLLKRCGAVIASGQHCRDDADSLREAFQSGTANEILIVTGGVGVTSESRRSTRADASAPPGFSTEMVWVTPGPA